MKEGKQSIPLVVDLDGSLIKTELPWESFLSVLVQHPIELIKILWKKIKINKACYFKIELQKWAVLSLDQQPFSNKFLAYLKEEKASGRKLILCTGSTQAYAEEIQALTGLFDSVWGSTLGKNLVGKKKAIFLIGKYGEKKFDYAGNSLADLKVARYARQFILVNPSFLVQFFSKKNKIHRQFMEKDLDPSLFADTLGFPLWFFNCIIFITPLFLSPPIGELFFPLAFSVVHFNFLGTGFYIFFQMMLITSDRKELIKKSNNLFATGNLSLSIGFSLCILFFLLAFISLVYLAALRPLTIIFSVLYILCVYLLVYKKIANRPVSVFIRYALLALAVLLQGFFI